MKCAKTGCHKLAYPRVVYCKEHRPATELPNPL